MNTAPARPHRQQNDLPHISLSSWILCAVMLCAVPLPALNALSIDPVSFFELPPRTFTLWHTSFSWGWWCLYAGLGTLTLIAIISQTRLHVSFPKSPGLATGTAALLLGISWLAAWQRWPWFAPLQRHTFILIWFSYIALMNALLHEIHGSCPLCRAPRQYLLSFPISALFWWIFEYLNRITQNWHYLNVQDFSALKYASFASLSFCTVLPSIWVTHEWLRRTLFTCAGDRTRSITMQGFLVPVAGLITAIISLAALPLLPDLLFPGIWLFPLLFVATAETVLRKSLHIPIAALCAWSMAGLWCGFLWEFWNAGSVAKWIYTIPLVQRFHLFEMPIVGYAGYFPFGVLCGLLIRSLQKEKHL